MHTQHLSDQSLSEEAAAFEKIARYITNCRKYAISYSILLETRSKTTNLRQYLKKFTQNQENSSGTSSKLIFIRLEDYFPQTGIGLAGKFLYQNIETLLNQKAETTIFVFEDVDFFFPDKLQNCAEEHQRFSIAFMAAANLILNHSSCIIIGTTFDILSVCKDLKQLFQTKISCVPFEPRIAPESSTFKNLFSNVFGLTKIKNQLYHRVILPILRPDMFVQNNIKFPTGVLLYGESGNGKTFMVNELVKQSKLNNIVVDGSDIVSSIVGESEKNITNLFIEARRQTPCLLVVDNVEVVSQARYRQNNDTTHSTFDRILSCFLIELDGIRTKTTKNKVDLIIVGITTKIEEIDAAFLRPGRFDLKLKIENPSLDERIEVFAHLLKQAKVLLGYNETKDLCLCLANSTKGSSYAEILNRWREMIMNLARKEMTENVIVLNKESILQGFT